MEDGPTAVPKDTEATAEARTEEAATATPTEGAVTAVRLKAAVTVILQREEAAMAILTEEVTAARTGEAAMVARLRVAVMAILQREEAATAILTEAATATLTEEVTAARTEGAATDTRLKVAVMVILQREEAATAHPREVSARQAEVSLHRAFGPRDSRDNGAGRGGFNKGAKFGGRGDAARTPARGNAKRSQAKPNPYKFNEADEKSINMMLSRKPQLDQIQLSDNDYVETPIKEVIRLNKFIANSGICSRREADQYIQAGVVTVNGEVISELGTKVNVLTDDIRFNGERIRGEEKVYIVMNKPKGYVTTASDPHADKTVMDLLKNCSARVFPVGRLDKSTTGVLMFTNDGEIAERLTHPSYDKKKIYQVILDKPLEQEDFDKIVNGITLSDGDIKADELEYIDAEDHRKLGIEIHSGKNRIVRRIFESLGYDVKALDRVYFAGLTKKGLKKGEWRYLSEGEANVLKMGSYV